MEACNGISRRDFLLGAVDTLFKPKVLINPGHNKYVNGSKYPGVGAEYRLCTDISKLIASELKQAGIQAKLTRDESDYCKEIVEYERQNRASLFQYVSKFREGRQTELSAPELIRQLAILHYAEAFSVLINIHLNDVPEANRKFTQGFAVGFSSHNAHQLSKDLAVSIHAMLQKEFRPSNNKAELLTSKGYDIPGLMDKQYVLTGNDIAPVRMPSVLIECGYIYEKYGSGKATIASQEIQVKYARKISDGIVDFLEILPYISLPKIAF